MFSIVQHLDDTRWYCTLENN